MGQQGHSFFFCKRALYKRRYSSKETYNFIDPTTRSHPIHVYSWFIGPFTLGVYPILCMYIRDMYMRYIWFVYAHIYHFQIDTYGYWYVWACTNIYTFNTTTRCIYIYTYLPSIYIYIYIYVYMYVDVCICV